MATQPIHLPTWVWERYLFSTSSHKTEVIIIKVAAAIDAFNFQLRFGGACCVIGVVSSGACCETSGGETGGVSSGAIVTTLGSKLIPVLLFVHSTGTIKR